MPLSLSFAIFAVCSGVRVTWCRERMLTRYRMNRRKADFKFTYKFLEDDI